MLFKLAQVLCKSGVSTSPHVDEQGRVNVWRSPIQEGRLVLLENKLVCVFIFVTINRHVCRVVGVVVEQTLPFAPFFPGSPHELFGMSRRKANKAAASPSGSQCACCLRFAHGNEEDKMKKCSRCRNVRYCSRECQKRHWNAHKANCKKGQPRSGPPKVQVVLRRKLAELDAARLDLRESGDGRADLYVCLADVAELFKEDGELESALRYASELLVLCCSHPGESRSVVASTCILIGGIHLVGGCYDDAMSHFERALAIATETRDRDLEASCYSYMAGVRHMERRNVVALGLIQESLKIWRADGNQESIATAVVDEALIKVASGDHFSALPVLEDAVLRLVAAGPDDGDDTDHATLLASMWSNLGVARSLCGDAERSLIAHDTALRLHAMLGSGHSRCISLYHRGKLHYDHQRFRLAIQDFEHHSAIASHVGVAVGPQVFEMLAKSYMKTVPIGAESLDRARVRTCWESAVLGYRHAGDTRAEAIALSVLGQVQAGEAMYVEAKSNLEASLALVSIHSDDSLLAWLAGTRECLSQVECALSRVADESKTWSGPEEE